MDDKTEQELEDLSAANVYEAPIKVVHEALLRSDKNSMFRSVCPICGVGTLLVQRNQTSFDLEPEDRCIFCGQSFIYTDIDSLKEKVGESK